MFLRKTYTSLNNNLFLRYYRTRSPSAFTIPIKTKIDNILITTNDFPKDKIEKDYGIVVGCHCESVNVFSDLYARIVGLFGGQVQSYSRLMSESTIQSMNTLIDEVKKHDANAIVDVHFEVQQASDPIIWSNNFSYCVAYGTIVKLKE